MPQHLSREQKLPTTIKRKIRKAMFQFISIFFVFSSCHQDCKNESILPSKEMYCSISLWSTDLDDFLFYYDSKVRLTNLTIVVNREKLQLGDLISFYDSNNSLALYKVKEIDPDFFLLETYIPLGPTISWKPESKEFRLKICNRNIEIYSNDNSNFADKPSGILSIL
jgi:hypothetical protein